MPPEAGGDVRPPRKTGKGVATARAAGAASSGKSTNGANAAKANGFDAQQFLASVGAGRSSMSHKAKAIIFQQGDPADAVATSRRAGFSASQRKEKDEYERASLVCADEILVH